MRFVVLICANNDVVLVARGQSLFTLSRVANERVRLNQCFSLVTLVLDAQPYGIYC